MNREQFFDCCMAAKLSKLPPKLSAAIPRCKKCGCNWPRKSLNVQGFCPNCAGEENR